MSDLHYSSNVEISDQQCLVDFQMWEFAEVISWFASFLMWEFLDFGGG